MLHEAQHTHERDGALLSPWPMHLPKATGTGVVHLHWMDGVALDLTTCCDKTRMA